MGSLPCGHSEVSCLPYERPSCLAVLAAYDRMLGLELEHLAVDGCSTKAPCGSQTAGPSPVDRRKQGSSARWSPTRGGIPLGAVPAPANRRDDGLLAATLGTIAVVGPLPERPVLQVVEFWLAMASAVIVCGRLLRRAWTCYPWPGRPRRRP